MASEPRPGEVADERERDCVVARAACLAGLAETVMAAVHTPSSEGSAFTCGAVAGDSTEVEAGAL